LYFFFFPATIFLFVCLLDLETAFLSALSSLADGGGRFFINVDFNGDRVLKGEIQILMQLLSIVTAAAAAAAVR
jgi:hypothetical protein